MKKYLITTVLLILIGFNSEAQDFKDFAGQWGFNCADAPKEYAMGDLIISKKENKIDVKIVYTNGATAKGESPKIKDGKLEYFVYTEDGDKINIALKIEDYKIKGTVFSRDGQDLVLTAKRKAF